MLALSNIAVRRGRKVLIEGASFQIHAGQRMGVIGANGCGKSSLFAMFLGELEPDDGELVLDERYELAHVAQESPRGNGSAVDYVMDGDRELREIQAAIADGEADPDRAVPRTGAVHQAAARGGAQLRRCHRRSRAEQRQPDPAPQ